MVKTQTRLVVLLFAIIGCFLLVMVAMDNWEKSRAQVLLTSVESGKRDLLRDIIVLKGASLTAFTNDYSLWDDMIAFVNSGDRSWAESNIDASLATYQVDAIWACRPDLSVVYSTSKNPPDLPIPLPVDSVNPMALFTGGFFRHYFVPIDNTYMEVRVAPIQPTKDDARKTPPQGFLFAAKIWDKPLLRILGEFTGGTLILCPMESVSSSWSSDLDKAIVRFADTLRSGTGQPLVIIRGEAPSVVLNELAKTVSRRSLITLEFVLALILSLIFALRAWVTRPLNAIYHALITEDPTAIAPITRNRTEFGRIARLISQFFEQKRQLLASNEKAEKLAEEQRIIFENTQDFIYRHDVRGVFHYLSASVEGTTGYTPAEFLRHYTTYMTDSPINARVVEFTELALNTGRAYPPYPVEIRRKDGRLIILEVSEKPYLENGQVAGIVGIARDVTARYNAEKDRRELLTKLEKAQRMESLAVLAGGVAHDLNNILGPLVAYPELILLKLPPDSPVRDRVESMGRAASQAAAMIDDLLAMARRGKYDMASIDLNEIIREYINSPGFHDLRRRNSGIQVHLELDTALPAIMGSRTHLLTILTNLASRAFESMPEGGHITVNSRSSYVETLASGYGEIVPGYYVSITVTDTGASIPKEDMNRIFEPYFSKNIASFGSSGGLGLSIVYGIVKDHSGYYEIDSAPGKGTSFSVLFPAITANTDITQHHADVLTGSETILIVDDVEEQRELAAEILRELGYTVISAANSRVALEQISHNHVDLVILDMIIENDQDGRDLYHRILEIRPGQKSIIISGYSATERVDEMQRLGAGSFVRKPFTRLELATAARRELDRNSAKSQKTC